MGKFTISADTVEGLHQAYAELFGALDTPAANGADAPAGAKATRSRSKKAEAPAPIQPVEAAAPFGQPVAGENPFASAAPTAATVATEPSPFVSASSGAFAPVVESAPVDRPAVAKLKEQLRLLGQQHGEAQVYTWAIQKGFGCSPSLTTEEFLTKTVHAFPDDALDVVYRQAGGK